LNTTKRIYSILSFALFTIGIGFFKLFHHQLWKDEWQAWFVSSEQGIGQLFSFLNYEGHPALFYLYLKTASLFKQIVPNQPELIIQWAHLILVGLMAYVFFVRFKMPLFLKIILALGYCFAFEYSVVNRGYVLVMLLSFWITTLINDPPNKSWLLPMALFLLCQTEVYGVFMAIGFVSFILLKANGSLVSSIKASFTNRSFQALGLGILVFVITVFPRGNTSIF